MLTRTVTVYSKPKCVQCKLTKDWLDKKGVPYETVDVSQDTAALEAIKSLGFMGVPVTIVSTGDPETDLMWYGFVPTSMEKYIHSTKAA